MRTPDPSQAQEAVLAHYRQERRVIGSPAGAMHRVRDIYATLIADQAVAGEPADPRWTACYNAAQLYLLDIDHRPAYWRRVLPSRTRG